MDIKMFKRCKIVPIILSCILAFFIGCGCANLRYDLIGTTENEFFRDQEERRKKLKAYIGMSKEEIQAEFGKPYRMFKDIPVIVDPKCMRGRECEYDIVEDFWIYRYSRGVIPFFSNYIYSYMFYFVDGKVKYARP